MVEIHLTLIVNANPNPHRLRHSQGYARERSGRERYDTGTEDHVMFRSRLRVPDRSRRWLLFPPSTIPPNGVLFPSHCLHRSRLFLVQPSAQLFSSYPGIRTRFLPSHISLLGQLFPFHSRPVFPFSNHVTQDGTELCSFNVGCDSSSKSLESKYIYIYFLPFVSPPRELESDVPGWYHAAYKVEYQPCNRSNSQLTYS